MKIYKFPLSLFPRQIISSKGAWLDPLCVQVQNNNPVLWARVHPADENAPAEGDPLFINIVPTGESDFNDNELGRYLGTFQLDGGAFVGHVFFE